MESNNKKIITTLRSGLAALLLTGAFMFTSCEDRPKQQTNEVSVDREEGQDEMMIDTTASAGKGSVGEVPPAGGPDYDTLKGVDKGMHPDHIYEEADSTRESE